MKSPILIFCLTVATVILAQEPTREEAQTQFCTYCGKQWEEKVPKNWAEITGYLNLACFQLHSTLKPQCMALVNSLDLDGIYENVRPKMIGFAKAVCEMYC